MTDPAWTSFPIFRNLSAHAVQTLGTQARRVDLGPNIEVIREGDAAGSLFCLVRGNARVVRRSSQQPIGQLAAPTVFGEMALVAATPRLATVVTETPCALFEVPRQAVFAAANLDPKLRDVLIDFHRDRLMRNVLGASSLFSSIDETRTRALAAEFVSSTVAAGTVLLREGAPGTGLFIILRGQCSVLRGSGLAMQNVARLAEGDLFGEISLALFDRPCTATVRAESECVLLQLSREAFQRLVMSDLELRTRIMHLALQRLNEPAQGRVDSSKPGFF